MPLYEVIPLVRCPIRGRLDAFFLQDVPDRLAADLLDAQFSEFSQNSGVTKASSLCHLNHYLTNLLRLSLATLRVFRLGLAVLLLANPAVERGRRNDRDEFFDRAAYHLPVLQEPFSLFGSCVHLPADASSKDLVFLFEIFDIFCQLVVRRGGD